MSKSETLPDVMRRAIKAGEWTAYGLAKASGVNVGVISRFVRNERDVNLRTADRLCRALKLELRFVRKAAGGKRRSQAVTRSKA